MVDVSIVLITWKMRDLLDKLLQSMHKYSADFTFELIIIDNNSQDGTIELIKEKYESAILIKNEKNKGVGPARNQGIRIAKGKYIMILDADMEFSDNSILHLFNFMEKNPQAGLIGCKLVDSNGQLQYSCKRFPKFSSMVYRRIEFNFAKNSKSLNNHLMKDWDHNEIAEVDYVIGACQFIRKSVMDKVGLYDDAIFYGPEDMDMCIRIWRNGSKVFYYPFTCIYHHEQRITKKKLFSMITFKHMLGILYLFKKYNGRLSR